MTPRRKQIACALFPAAVFAVFASSMLWRPLWFDEVINLTNFAVGRSPLEIYNSYVIPNNHILYSVFLSLWSLPLDSVPFVEPWLRLSSFLIGLLTLFTAFRLFRTRIGSVPLAIALAALGSGSAFLIYGTALRGYMPGMLFTVLALNAALALARWSSPANTARYFLWSLAAVAVIPSNIFAVGAAALYALPLLGNDFYRRRGAYLLALAPLAALVLFYGPIWRDFIACAALREGWEDHFGALAAVNAVTAVSFCMLLLPAAIGGVIVLRRPGFRRIFTARLLVLFLPVIPCMVLPVAPFPRTFFPYLFVAALIFASGLKHLDACFCRLKKRWDWRWLAGGLAVIVVGWSALFMLNPTLRLAMGWRFGGIMRDDFFAPYYTLESFNPASVVREMAKLPLPAYASFGSDPYALSFYAALRGLPPGAVLFDSPRGRVDGLPGIMVLRRDEDIADTARRFGARADEFTPAAESGLHVIYLYSPGGSHEF